MLNILIFSDYDGLRNVRKQKKTDRMVNIDKEKYEINSLHVDSCYDFMRPYLLYCFRKINTNPLYAHNSYNM